MLTNCTKVENNIIAKSNFFILKNELVLEKVSCIENALIFQNLLHHVRYVVYITTPTNLMMLS